VKIFELKGYKMPVNIQLDNPPLGYCVDGGVEGETVRIRNKGFLYSENGEEFVTYLEGMSNCYHDAFVKANVSESEIDNFLAIVHPDATATVYLNEIQPIPTIRFQGFGAEGIKAGSPITIDNIADVDCLELQDVNGLALHIPADCGLSLVLSHRWRKGYYFDYSVFGPHAKPRTDDLPPLLGHFFARLIFQDMFSATPVQWMRLFELGWFPFIGLRHDDRRALLKWSGTERMPDSVLDEAARTFVASLDQRLAIWANREHLQLRMPFLIQAKARLDADDYLSCINLLYPQIEGVMRGCFVDQSSAGRPNQNTMVAAVAALRSESSLLLPTRFVEYLLQVYFQDFNERVGNVPLSRHTISHGVSNPADYDFRRAAVAFMVLDQLFFYMNGQATTSRVVTTTTGTEQSKSSVSQPQTITQNDPPEQISE
jgi:hypothetical protein